MLVDSIPCGAPGQVVEEDKLPIGGQVAWQASGLWVTSKMLVFLTIIDRYDTFPAYTID